MSDEKKLAIIATKGTLDWAYPPFILASTAAALGYETQIFFTFYGLQLLRKKLNLQVTSLGNPAMPMPMPVPVILQAMPGMQGFMTSMMNTYGQDSTFVNNMAKIMAGNPQLMNRAMHDYNNQNGAMGMNGSFYGNGMHHVYSGN